jgi:cytochrome P450
MTTIEFDPVSSTFFDDPYDLYRRLRDESPVYYSVEHDFYALSRYDDVRRGLRDWSSFTSTHGSNLAMVKSEGGLPNFDIMLMMDPPKHDRLRALISRGFTPAAVAALEPMIHDVVCGYLDQLSGRDEFDAVTDFAAPFPVEIISRILGVPEADRQLIRHRIDLSLHREPGQMGGSPAGQQAFADSLEYFHQLVADKRNRPADDLLSRLTQVEVDRGDGEQTRLTDSEIAGFAQLLGGAGSETVTKLIGNAVVLFSRHDDQWQKILNDEQSIPGAVEELLRYWAPLQYAVRYSVRDSEFQGEVIPAGHPVLLLIGSATRDDREFEAPDKFDIGRPPAFALGLGYGIHVCLGAALARIEGRVAIRELARRWPQFAVDASRLKRVTMTGVAGFSSVPVGFL